MRDTCIIFPAQGYRVHPSWKNDTLIHKWCKTAPFIPMMLSCMLEKDHFFSLTSCPAKPLSRQQLSPIRSNALYAHPQHSMRQLEQETVNLKGLGCIVPKSRMYLACHLILGGLSQEFDVIHFAIRVEGVHEDAEAPARCGLLVVELGEDTIFGLCLQHT